MAPTIRQLTRKDRKILTAMLVKLATKIGSKDVLNVISPDKETSPEDQGGANSLEVFGVEVFKSLLEYLEDDLCVWLASLIDYDIEAFDGLPFGIELDLINQVLEADGFNDFFTQASHLRNKVTRLAGIFGKKN